MEVHNIAYVMWSDIAGDNIKTNIENHAIE